MSVRRLRLHLTASGRHRHHNFPPSTHLSPLAPEDAAPERANAPPGGGSLPGGAPRGLGALHQVQCRCARMWGPPQEEGGGPPVVTQPYAQSQGMPRTCWPGRQVPSPNQKWHPQAHGGGQSQGVRTGPRRGGGGWGTGQAPRETPKTPVSLEKQRLRAEALGDRTPPPAPAPPTSPSEGPPPQGVPSQRKRLPPGDTHDRAHLRPPTQRPPDKAAPPATLGASEQPGQLAGGPPSAGALSAQPGRRHRLGKWEVQWRRGRASGTWSGRPDRGKAQALTAHLQGGPSSRIHQLYAQPRPRSSSAKGPRGRGTHPQAPRIRLRSRDPQVSSWKIHTLLDYKEPAPQECFLLSILLEMPHKHSWQLARPGS